MKKGRIFIRLMMLIFIVLFPIYQLYILGREYTVIRRENQERKRELTEEVRSNFLLRDETFYRDKKYQREHEKLYSEK